MNTDSLIEVWIVSSEQVQVGTLQRQLLQLKTGHRTSVFVFKFIHNTDKNVIILFAFFFFLKYGYNLKYAREGDELVP